MAGDATTVDDFMVAHARDFNCLADEDRTTRKRALQKLSSLPSTQPPDVLAHAWRQRETARANRAARVAELRHGSSEGCH